MRALRAHLIAVWLGANGLTILAHVASSFWATAGSATTGPTVIDIGTLVTNVGVNGLLFYLYRDERALRIKRDEQLFDFLERFGPLLVQSADTLKEVNNSQKSMVGQMPNARDWDRSLAELSRIKDDLKHELDETRRHE